MTKEIQKVETARLPAHLQSNAQELTGEFMGSIDPRLPVIKVMSGAGCLFQKDKEAFPGIKCIIIGAAKVNAMWVPTEEPAASNFWRLFDTDLGGPDPKVPICHSVGAQTGSHIPVTIDNGGQVFGFCKMCYFNQFRSDLKGGAGKACGNRRRLLLLLPNSPIPHFLTLPPTSIRPYDDYVRILMEKGANPAIVYSHLTLDKEMSKIGKEYSAVRFNLPAEMPWISPEDNVRVSEFRHNFVAFLQKEATDEEFGAMDSAPTADPAPHPAETDPRYAGPPKDPKLGF